MAKKNAKKNTTEKQKNPHLFCLITGKSRPTTWEYLNEKADRLGTTADHLVDNYVSREAVSALLKGKTVEEIRAIHTDAPKTKISQERLGELIATNSKAKKAAEKFTVGGTSTAEPPAAPKKGKSKGKGKSKKAAPAPEDTGMNEQAPVEPTEGAAEPMTTEEPAMA